MNFSIIKTNIVNIPADAIVLPTNTQLKEGSGASADIFKAAGKKILTDDCAYILRKIGKLEHGDAVATCGYDLKANFIIHAVVPKRIDGKHGEYKSLCNTYSSTLKLAELMKCESIAFPLLGAGFNKFDVKTALEVAVKSFSEFKGNSLQKIILVIYDEKAVTSVEKKGYQYIETEEFTDIPHRKLTMINKMRAAEDAVASYKSLKNQKNIVTENKNISTSNVKSMYYRGITYSILSHNSKFGIECWYCRNRTREYASINVKGQWIFTCEKCARYAIDKKLGQTDVKEKTGSNSTLTSPKTVKKKSGSIIEYIDELIKKTNAGSIIWEIKNGREGNYPVTTFYSREKNIEIKKTEMKGYIQYVLVENMQRINSSQLKSLEQAIKNQRAKNNRLTGNTASFASDTEQSQLEKRQIQVKDFVVRRSVFRCMHNNHELKNIVGIITVIDSRGLEKQMKVTAGYCKTCNIYFILESAYEKIRRIGIPLCRTCDEKNYLKQSSANGMLLAQESILMQYGYSVSQTVGLSAKTRQKILAILIDYKILAKSEIISYFDFFISQRQTQSKYKYAIAKWEEDREFVENYKIGMYQSYQINGIRRT